MGKLKRTVVLAGVVAVGVVAGMVGGAVSASAEGAPCSSCAPWWILEARSLPGNLLPGGEGRVSVVAEDVGSGAFDFFEGVVLRVKLPEGLTAQSSQMATGSSGVDENGQPCEMQHREVVCSIVGLELASLYTYDHIDLYIGVAVAEDAKSGDVAASISGGGAPSVSVSRPVVVSREPTRFGVDNYELRAENADGSPDTQAGSHPFQLTSVISLNQSVLVNHPAQALKDLHFDLPPGLIGNPTPFPRCTIKQFLTQGLGDKESECPADTAVGVASTTLAITNPVSGREAIFTFAKPLFNLEPSYGEPARFGFDAGEPIYLDTSVKTGGDYAVKVDVDNISELVGFTSTRVTFWGVPGDPRHNPSRGWECLGGGTESQCSAVAAQTDPPPLLTLPTACTGPVDTSVEADSWEHEGAFTPPFEYTFKDNLGRPVGLDGCNQLPFTPSVRVTPDGQAGSTPTGLTVDEHVPQESDLNPTGLSESAVKGLSVTLPEGVALNPSAADGLQACSLEEIGLQSAEAAACPEASKVATVKIKTPLLAEPLEGAAYLAAQNQNPFGSLVALYVYAEAPVAGIRAKAAGEVLEDPVTGQLTAHFEGDPIFENDPRYAAQPEADFLPEVPFEDIEVHFFGGDRAPLTTPARCGSYTTTGTFTPWAGNASAESSSTFNITSGPNGKPCSNPLPFNPSLAVGTTSIQAGGFTPFEMTMSREDGEQPLRGITLHMPKGVSGTLSSVKLCGEEQADAGTCGPESELGETIVSVGVGSDPYTVKGGKVYITGPYKGAPFGLSIVNPAKAGPFDLGKVVVRAKLEVNEETAAITVTTDNEGPYKIPTLIDGIPLQIKHVFVNIDRPGFTFNATNCNPLAITGTLVSTEGASSNLAVPYQVTNCAVLAFKPQLEASTSGKTSRANGASFHVKLGYPAGPYDANIAKVKVELPKALPSRLTTLQKACTVSVFNANPAGCPPASIVGHATASTPVLPVPLSGPAYFVSHGGEAFPSLIIVLQGYGVTVHLVGSTFIDKAGITSSTFKTVPDVPVGTFELTLPEGPYSALAANGSLCKQKLAMPTEFVGQNGTLIKTSTKIAVTGCGKTKKTKKAKHKKRSTRGKKRKKK